MLDCLDSRPTGKYRQGVLSFPNLGSLLGEALSVRRFVEFVATHIEEICAPNSSNCSSEKCSRSRAYRSSETFAGDSASVSASSISRRSTSVNTLRSLPGRARSFSSVNPAFLPTAELMSTQKGQPIRAAVRTLAN